ncbi:hypothetical protein BJY52DRAFT_1281640 [Lactarius psammicola]|nr:hypothetical protein BJY52DRAFT_1281640 [Lactarius psammicola]
MASNILAAELPSRSTSDLFDQVRDCPCPVLKGSMNHRLPFSLPGKVICIRAYRSTRVGHTRHTPLQYDYCTKITPHFEPLPKKLQKQGPSTGKEGTPSWLKICFSQTGK